MFHQILERPFVVIGLCFALVGAIILSIAEFIYETIRDADGSVFWPVVVNVLFWTVSLLGLGLWSLGFALWYVIRRLLRAAWWVICVFSLVCIVANGAFWAWFLPPPQQA